MLVCRKNRDATGRRTCKYLLGPSSLPRRSKWLYSWCTLSRHQDIDDHRVIWQRLTWYAAACRARCTSTSCSVSGWLWARVWPRPKKRYRRTLCIERSVCTRSVHGRKNRTQAAVASHWRMESFAGHNTVTIHVTFSHAHSRITLRKASKSLSYYSKDTNTNCYSFIFIWEPDSGACFPAKFSDPLTTSIIPSASRVLAWEQLGFRHNWVL